MNGMRYNKGMVKALQSDWQLSNSPLSREDFVQSFQDFEYYTSHCQQIIDKRRRLVYMRLNAFQKYMFGKLLSLLEPGNRLDKRHDIVICKPRQCGMSVGMMAFINWFLSCVDGIENFNFIHILPATDTISKLYTQKVAPIITGVHPDIMATVEKLPAMTSSIRLYYKDIIGVRRNNYYDLVSANASSLRSGTANAILYDEVSFYRHPEELEDAVSPMLPAYGFSLVIYASTFDDKQSDYFKKKIITARDNPEDWTLLFAPFFMVYPEEPQGLSLEDIELTEYDETVIMPAMAEYGLPKKLWADAIDWYHKTSLRTTDMKKEYPTTIEELLAIGENKSCFTEESLAKQEKNILPDKPYRLLADALTKKFTIQETDESPIMIYKQPIAGRRYMLTCDPISSNSSDSDFFACSMWDTEKNEQVATILARDLMMEDLAELVAGLSTVYNRAIVCPEKNMSEALQACLRAQGFYNFFYADSLSKDKREAGIRTTVTSKPTMIDKLQIMLECENITIHSAETLRQLKAYERRVKDRVTGGSMVSFSAPKGDHDDFVSCCFIYAGTKRGYDLMKGNSAGFAVCW